MLVFAGVRRSAGPRVAGAYRSATWADRKRTEATFPVVDGRRSAVPGDRATGAPDGTIRMLGRGSMLVNTGGEKVFVEEVEKALLRHPSIVDVLVVGRPSPRCGQEVVALVQTRAGEAVSPRELRVRRPVHRPVQGTARHRVLRRHRPPFRPASPTTSRRARSRSPPCRLPARNRRWTSASAARGS